MLQVPLKKHFQFPQPTCILKIWSGKVKFWLRSTPWCLVPFDVQKKLIFFTHVRLVLWDQIQFKTSLQVKTAFYQLLTNRLLNYRLLFHSLLNHCIIKSDVTSPSSKNQRVCTSKRPSTTKIAASKSVGYLPWPDL